MSSKKGLPAHKTSILKSILFYKYFYLMLLPVVAWYAIFAYAPMYGITLAFKTFHYGKGILGSPWIGFQNFIDLMSDTGFWSAFKNTIIISFGKLLFHFPTPIILAILLNELIFRRAKKVFQTILTFPHFISWIVLAGIMTNILGQSGVVNQVISNLGGGTVPFLSDPSVFRPVIYISHIWKEIGWDSIIYIAALAGISPELYEAAKIDGASRWHQIRYVTWPGIRPTVAILFILTIGQMLNLGSSFDQIFNLYSSPVYGVADTIDTFVYRTTFTIGADFGYMTAVGFLKSAINVAMIYLANTLVKKSGEQGLF
ncbi:ABC transporter permease [Ruminiclostridium cellobioparum]|jgi:putative aldouronate transport system permease protein|uniref:ABC-type polysaccharide transport system, permease component n=1 Tax=Ruminiclostridium cellobioparum subsp. termitidis CT1112 TaxID=1195236 RepID=S0FV97_RUMCE|nr:ABC transporter permease subunit [Ruminiclostridium cellobioparum]EMS72453.1 ABC-type polysaccharide transport system, permease component [Ruminiclostridium cellobioparum subsp. termitidis CT1112]